MPVRGFRQHNPLATVPPDQDAQVGPGGLADRGTLALGQRGDVLLVADRAGVPELVGYPS